MAAPFDLDKLNRFLAHKIQPCPLCHKKDTYAVIEDLMELREYNATLRPAGTMITRIPLVVVCCTNCGNSILINALQADLVSPNEPEET